MDGTLSVGTKAFQDERRRTEGILKSSANILDSIISSGIQIAKLKHGYRMDEARDVSGTEKDPECSYFELLRSIRHKLALLGGTNPVLVVPGKILSQVTDKIFHAGYIQMINQVVERSHAGGKRGIMKW